MKRQFLTLFLFTLASISGYAQLEHVIRGDCTPGLLSGDSIATARGNAPRSIPSVNWQWDAERVYRQLVILVSFSDLDFNREDPRAVYNDIFNKEGYNERNGPGCVADYFRCQSGGLMNMEFDVFGPYKVSSKAQPYEKPNKDVRNYGTEQIREATQKFLAENPNTDFEPYDWNGDGYVNQIIYVFAGYCGNQDIEACYGYLWPNTSTIAAIVTPDGKRIYNYTVSAELWANNTSCGIGTICHEFTHSLGLPDIYPTRSGAGYSVVDEWDLMDGGNFTNYGWCPPNYSALEKMLLGWLTPVDLTDPQHIESMGAVADGGEVYLVRNIGNEYYLLENRQQKGWDLGLPGKGLAIFHVIYSDGKWSSNTVNNNRDAYGYSIVHADNMDYDTWYDRIIASGSRNPYVNKPRLNNSILSTSSYPWSTDSTLTVNAELTDISVPAAEMYFPNVDGERLMSKPITRITQNPDGTIAFDFMGGDNSGIIQTMAQQPHYQTFDLCGRVVGESRGIVIVRASDGTVRKVLR